MKFNSSENCLHRIEINEFEILAAAEIQQALHPAVKHLARCALEQVIQPVVKSPNPAQPIVIPLAFGQMFAQLEVEDVLDNSLKTEPTLDTKNTSVITHLNKF